MVALILFTKSIEKAYGVSYGSMSKISRKVCVFRMKKRNYRILYDKVFALSEAVPIELNGKKYFAFLLSVMIEYQTFDANGKEIFYHSEDEKPYNIDGVHIYENDFTKASIENNRVIVEATDTVKVLESLVNRTFCWAIKGWYIDIAEDEDPCITEPISVSEDFFNDFVKKHIKKLTNTDNAESLSVNWSLN